MKRLFYGLIFLVLLTQSVAAQKKSDREIDGLIGSVSTIRRCIAEMQNKDGSWVEEEKKYPRHIFYERDGKSHKKTPYSYHLGCYNDVKVTNTYDSLGNRIMTLSLTDSDTKIYKGKWVYVYDNNDREIEHLFYNQANEM